MSATLLSDPTAMAATGSIAGNYAAAFAREGAAHFISNVRSKMQLLHHRLADLPVTIDDGGYGRSYVASPHSAYVLYAREEMDLVGMRRGRIAASVALFLLDVILRAARINQVVHLDNWLLSTNLHGAWQGDGLPSIRRLLMEALPDHYIILRTLDEWSSPKLLEAAKSDGWSLIPARQIWVVDDLKRDWRPRHDYLNDRRALAKSGLTVEDSGELNKNDCDRIAELYAMLYVGRYSALNPIFTGAFIALTQVTGLIQYRVARDAGGTIMSVAGMLARNGVMTPPIVGYDTTQPKSSALYRIACFMFSDWAMERGLALHGSAGAAHFKRQRGAHGVIEYLAVYADHLSVYKRNTVRGLSAVLQRYAVPMMQREGW